MASVTTIHIESLATPFLEYLVQWLETGVGYLSLKSKQGVDVYLSQMQCLNPRSMDRPFKISMRLAMIENLDFKLNSTQ